MAVHKSTPDVGSGSSRSMVSNQMKKGERKVTRQEAAVENTQSELSTSDSRTLRAFVGILVTVLVGMLVSRLLQQNPSVARYLSTVSTISTSAIGSDSSIVSRMESLVFSHDTDKLRTSDILVTAYTKSEYVPTGWRLIRKIPRPSKYFTQGLAFRGEELFESTGLYGESGVFVVSLKNETYTVKEQTMIDNSQFGEGLALWPPYLENEQSTQALPEYVTGSRRESHADEDSSYDDEISATDEEEDIEHSDIAPRTVPKTADGRHTKEMILQLTWREGIVNFLDPVTLNVVDQVAFDSTRSEGWGITTDGLGTFIQTDGSSSMHFWSTNLRSTQDNKAMMDSKEGVHFVHAPEDTDRCPVAQITYSHAGNAESKLEVVDAVNPQDPLLQSKVSRSTRGRDLPVPGSPQRALNELEFIHGWVFANIWYDNHVAIIHPGTGQIVWYLDFTQLVKENTMHPSDCFNGLAYTMRLDIADPEGEEPKIASEPWKGRLWVTGKFWSNIYEIELTDLVLASELADISH